MAILEGPEPIGLGSTSRPYRIRLVSGLSVTKSSQSHRTKDKGVGGTREQLTL